MIRNLDESPSGSPHSLIELYSKQWTHLEENSIIVSEIHECKDKNKSVGYKNVTLGSEVYLRKRRGFSNGKHLY